jgi:hypothetical protein
MGNRPHKHHHLQQPRLDLILEPAAEGKPDPLAISSALTASGKKGDRQLLYKDKVISTAGAKDSGAIGVFHGQTMSIAYCDEMTLYPDQHH